MGILNSGAFYYIIFYTSFNNKLNDDTTRLFLYDYICFRSKSLGCDLIKIGGDEESVHFAISIPPTISLYDVVCILKSSSQNYIHKNFKNYNFFWKSDFFYKTISEENLPDIIKVIDFNTIPNNLTLSLKKA
ncbi:MAG TPA: transposase [Bacteroidota bacterium]|jgi:REP element-mobilizing transposase RayT|nr:transposase [Bacteroidota bacterium]